MTKALSSREAVEGENRRMREKFRRIASQNSVLERRIKASIDVLTPLRVDLVTSRNKLTTTRLAYKRDLDEMETLKRKVRALEAKVRSVPLLFSFR